MTQTIESIFFKPDNADSVAAEQYTINVPENRAKPDSRMIPLRFLRFASRADRPGAPIIYLAGGPGGSGTGAAKGRRWQLFDRLRDVADVIILDQRGTGRSNTIPPCETDHWISSDQPATRAVYTQLYSQALQECRAFWEGEGIDLSGYTTVESAADIEAIRQTLGVDQVSLLGISYGTHLALATLKYHPGSIDRLVLASAEGLNQTVKRPAYSDAYFDRLQAAIDRDSAAKALYPDVKGLIRNVLRQLDANPPTFSIQLPDGRSFEHTLSAFELQRIAGGMASSPENMKLLLRNLRRAQEGDFASFRFFFRVPIVRLRGMSEAMDIASGISEERLRQVRAEAETAVVGDALNFPMPHLRDAWPEIDLGDAFRNPVQSDRPALFLSGTLDGRTMLEGQAEVASGFDDRTTVTIEYAGHNLFFSHPDVVEIVADFFAGKKVENQTLTAELPLFGE